MIGEKQSSRLEDASQDSLSFPCTVNERKRPRNRPVRLNILMREFMNMEDSPPPSENTTAKANFSSAQNTADSDCDATNDEPLGSDDILNTSMREEKSGNTWLNHNPEDTPLNMFKKLSFKDCVSVSKADSNLQFYMDKEDTPKVASRVPLNLFKTPTYKIYSGMCSSSTSHRKVYPKESCMSIAKKKVQDTPDKPFQSHTKSHDYFRRSMAKNQLFANTKQPPTPSAAKIPTIDKKQNSDLILRENNLNINNAVLKENLPPKTSTQTDKHLLVSKQPPTTSETDSSPEEKKPSNVPPKISAVPAPKTTLSESTTFKSIKVQGKEYIMINKLGEGGSGQVYRCLEQETLQDRAIKIVNLAVDANAAANYVNEVKMLKLLQKSDRVIRMFDYEKSSQTLFVVMERGDVDFSVFLKQITTDPQTQTHVIIYYWIEMLKCVREIHNNDIIHSDLKPSNFLLVGGKLKLIDFGISSKISSEMTSVIKNEQVGTFNYISPESLMDSRESPSSEGKPRIKITRKSDVWSLGCILYQMIYRKTPFHSYGSWMTKIIRIIDKNHRIEYPHVERIPLQLIETMKKCLTYDMKSRPSVEELLNMHYTGDYY